MNSNLSRALLFAALLGLQGPIRAQQQGADADFRAIEALDTRVATIGHRLAVANVGLCATREWRPGLVFIDLAQVAPAFRAMMSRTFGAQAGLGIAALVADGPGARAGLRAGDVVLALDGRELVPAPTARPETAEAMLRAVDGAFADGQANVAVRRGDRRLEVAVRADQGCASRFEIVRNGGRQGSADGRIVEVTLNLVNYAADDAELAAVLAHEFAHNILRHRARLDAARISRGFFANFGRNARLIRETEIEADRMSVYLMDRAGYDPSAAVRFWSRFGPSGLGFLGSPTHPNWHSRIALLETEIAAIRRARAEGRQPVPPFGPPAG